jgi:WhiB family redox-sensing transcriptional regulator
MGKSTLNVFDNADQLKMLLRLYDVMEVSGVIPNCTNDPDLFYPETKNTNASYENLAVAKNACRSCPLMDACATYAIAAHERDGIWGGLTPYEREERRRVIIRKNDTAAFQRKGYVKYFRLKPKTEQLPINSLEIHD